MNRVRSEAATGLRIARGYIEEGWTQKTQARNSRGEKVNPLSAHARSFCAEGACVRAFEAPGVSYGTPFAALRVAMDALRRHSLPLVSVAESNDNVIRSQTEALDWFDQAIADLEEA